MPVVIRHVSDTHGSFPESTQEFDFTIISGDILPNFADFHPSNRLREATNQEHWVKSNEQQLIDWSRAKPVYYIHGNHDFLHESYLEDELGWRNLNNKFKVYSYNNEPITLYGFPWIPKCTNGIWNYELSDSDMIQMVQKMVDEFQYFGYPDILVCHSPPYGILDKSWVNLGNMRLTNALNYKFTKLPKLVLFGHIHGSPGIEDLEMDNLDTGKSMVTFSNAATTQN